MAKISIDLARYPLFSRLPDPEAYILAIMDQHHAVFKAQDTSLLTYTNSEVFEMVEETCNTKLEGVLSSMKETCTRRLDPLIDTLRTSVEDLATYKNKLPCLDRAVDKGAVGERLLEQYLIESLSQNEYDIELVSSEKNSGDILISKRNIQIMIDVKYYTNTVPTKEVEKLKRDMKVKKI